jgi:sarcosine/dimethylglycine N-methyltransferase
MTQSALTSSVAHAAESYYDSSEADRFYFNIWGGEDIHVGIYENDDEAIASASRRTIERMASRLELLPTTRVLDLGAGYGGSARHLAEQFGCHVTCLNLSETQNRRNREVNAARGLADRIDVVYGNFETLPMAAETFDVVWSEDAILHSGNRDVVLAEVSRVLRPKGDFVFTDPMQADDCPPSVLGPVLERIHLDTMGSFAYYRDVAKGLGLTEVAVEDLTPHLTKHYGRVRAELQARYEEMVRLSTQAYVDRMIQGLGHWVDAGHAGYLAWGILHFRK